MVEGSIATLSVLIASVRLEKKKTEMHSFLDFGLCKKGTIN